MPARWITAALLLVASPLVGQELEVGDRVRVTAPTVSEEPVVGTYWGIRDDMSLVLTTGDVDEPVAVPLNAVEQMEAVTGTRGHFWAGALLGALGFGAAFFAIAAASDSELVHEDYGAAAAGGMGLLVGAPIGGLVGALVRSDVWEPVELPAKPMVAVHPTGRFSLGVSIPMRR